MGDGATGRASEEGGASTVDATGGDDVEVEMDVGGERGEIFDAPVTVSDVAGVIGSRPVGMDELARALRRGRAVGLGRGAAYGRRQRRAGRAAGVARVVGGARGVRSFLTGRVWDHAKKAAAAASAVWRTMAGGMHRVRDEWIRFCAARRRQGPTRDGETRIHGRPPEG